MCAIHQKRHRLLSASRTGHALLPFETHRILTIAKQNFLPFSFICVPSRLRYSLFFAGVGKEHLFAIHRIAVDGGLSRRGDYPIDKGFCVLFFDMAVN